MENYLEDLIEEVKTCLSIYRQNIQEQYAESLWQTGEAIVENPLYATKKSEIIKILAQATDMSARYFYYAIKIYNEFPFPTFEEALPEMMKRTQRTVITERSLIALVEGKKEVNHRLRKFKNAKEIKRDELKNLIDKASYVKIYIEKDAEYEEQLFKAI